MSGRVLCKLPSEEVLVVKNSDAVRYEVKPLATGTKINKGDLIAELEIYDANGLLFKGNLYSIIDN